MLLITAATAATVGLLIYLLYLIIEFKIGFNSIKKLSSQVTLPSDFLSSVSIIFSARNEERILAKSIQSILNLNYPNFEIIAVNDRSTDNTSSILNQFESHACFKAKHIQQLAKGWLGKNSALHIASQSAKGEWLLFTDADVLMDKDLIAKAISYALENNIDHLTIYEHHISSGFWLMITLLATYITYSMVMMPWRIKCSWSKKSLGHGAFNLVKKSCYLECGGHRSIAMECFDDLKLGKLIKDNGFKQDIVDGKGLIERAWYHSLNEMIHGLKKNGFAYFNYSFLRFFTKFIFGLFFFISPWAAIVMLQGPLQWLNLMNIILTFWVAFIVAERFYMQKYYVLFYPIGILVLFYTLWHSVITTYRRHGIIWRDTYYSLEELRNR